MGGIDEAALDRLSLVTEMTKHIRVRASDGASADPSELAAFTPSFIWLLRDFYLRLEEDGRKVTPRDYLESALQALPGNNASVESKNNIRQSIKALFPNRDCFTLVRPVNDEDSLANLDTLDSSHLRPEFKQGLSDLMKLTFQKAMPKRLGNQVLTGPSLAGLAEAYVAAINAGAVPTIATAWQGVAEAESRRAADAAEAAYAASFPRDVPADDLALESSHQAAMAEAQKVFDASALGDESVKKANEKRWRETCTFRFRELREKKLATAALACEKAINEATARLAAIVRREGSTMEDLHREAAEFKDQYAASTEFSGPDKWPRLAAFMQDVYGNAQRDLAAKVTERQRAEAQQAQHAAQVAHAAVQHADARATAAESSVATLQARIADLENQLRMSQADLVAQRQTAGSHIAQLTAAQREIAALQRDLTQQASARDQHWESQKNNLETQIGVTTAAKDAAEAARGAAEAGRAAAEQHVAALQAEVNFLKAQVASLEMAAAAAPPPAPVSIPARVPAVPAEPMDEDMFFSAGPGTDVEPSAPPAPAAAPAVVPAVHEIPDVSKMTINAIKQWLTEKGHEAKVWEMSQAKAKKSDWVQFVNSLAP